jgi:hypothetical protein
MHTRDENYAAIKILTANSIIRSSFENATELTFLERITSTDVNHPGRKHCLSIEGHFEQEGTHGKHLCLVFQPLCQSVSTLSKATSHSTYQAGKIGGETDVGCFGLPSHAVPNYSHRYEDILSLP